MSELDEIRRIGAVPQKNSGRGWIDKGDAILGDFLVDVKEYNQSFGVSRKVWAKLQSDAFRAGRRNPALFLVLGSEDERQKLRLFVVGEEIFQEMREAWEEKNERDNDL